MCWRCSENNRGLIADLDKAIEISPQKAVPLVLRARIQQQSGNLEAAATDLAKVLKDQPGNPAALELRGLMAADAGEYSAAIRDFTTIAKQDPPDPLVLGPTRNVASCCKTASGRHSPGLESHSLSTKHYF